MIQLKGSIAEVGGIGEVFENLIVYVGNGSNCVENFEGVLFHLDRTLWNVGNFSIFITAPGTLVPGPIHQP